MDIAAERRFPNFVILRERYWSSLDARERERAIDVGRPLMDAYGDESAGPRLAKILRRYQHVSTGSPLGFRSDEHTSELQSLMRISYAVFCLKKNNTHPHHNTQPSSR